MIPRCVVWMSLAGTATLAAGIVYGQSPATGSGQAYPSKSIRIITAGVGGGNDLTARIIAQGIAAPLGQPVLVENRAGGSISAEIVAKAPPDGYTLLVGTGSMWLGPFLQKVGYDPVQDFAPITLAVRAPNILVVHPSLPVKSVKDLIALAKSKPAALNYSAGSPGGATHLAAEMFNSMAGVKIQYISYKSSTMETSDLLGGYVQLTFGAAGSVSPHVKSGKLRALAVTSAEPSTLFPGLPTIAAAGGLPGYELGIMYGFWAPAKTPTAIVNRLNQETVRVLNMPDTKERFLVTGVETVANSPEQFAAVIKTDMAKLGKVIKDVGIKAE